MRPEDLLVPTPSGVCCKPGGFHIDPTRPVDKAVITHGHSDHARAGHAAVLATQETLDLMRLRYGENFAGATQAIGYGETVSARRRDGDVPSGRPRARLGPGRDRMQWAARSSRPATTRTWPIRPALPSSLCPAMSSSPRRRSDCRCSATAIPMRRSPRLLRSVALFPERAHLVGVYSLGKAQRVLALIRAAGYDKPVYLHGALERITRYYQSSGIDLGEVRLARDASKAELAGAIALCPPSALKEVWTRRFPDPVSCFASGWMRVRARARQRGVELPLVISDHADWDGLTATIAATGASDVWVTHGQEDALVHWSTQRGLAARPLAIVGYGDEEDRQEEPKQESPACISCRPSIGAPARSGGVAHRTPPGRCCRWSSRPCRGRSAGYRYGGSGSRYFRRRGRTPRQGRRRRQAPIYPRLA